MTDSDQDDRAARHKVRMQRKKEIIDAKVAKATIERGIVILLSGNGKGKSSSAFGTLIRCIGHGYRAGVVQFIKGTWDCGERNFIQKLCPEVPFHVMGTGFTWETQDQERDKKAAEAAWEEAEKLLKDESLRLVVFDEITYVLRYKYLDLERVLEAIRNRPKDMTVIVTGRGAPKELEELADTVSEVRDVKHAFRAGIKAQKGIEW